MTRGSRTGGGALIFTSCAHVAVAPRTLRLARAPAMNLRMLRGTAWGVPGTFRCKDQCRSGVDEERLRLRSGIMPTGSGIHATPPDPDHPPRGGMLDEVADR